MANQKRSGPSRLHAYRALMAFSFGAAPWASALFLFLGVLMSLTIPAAAVGAKLLVDAAVAGSVSRGLVAAGVLALTAATVLIVVLYYVDLLFIVAEKAGATVDRRLIDLMAGVPGLEHHERPEYLDRLDVLREERARLAWMTNATAGMVRVATQLVASSILLARLSPLLLLLPLAGIASFWTGRRDQDLQIRAAEETAEAERLRRHLFDTATAAAAGKEVRVFGLGDELVKRHHEAAERVLQIRNRADRQGAWLQAAGGLVTGLSYVGAIALILLRAVNGQATPGDVVLAAGLAAGMNATITTAVFYGTNFLRLLRLAQRYLWLEEYARRAWHRPGTPTPAPNRLTHGIDLHDLSFRYPGTESWILDGVSLHLPAGTVVALVGENGAGKTTLVKLLSRFYAPTSGRITVDGADLHEFDVEAWRERAAAAFQDFSRFELLARETVGVGDLPRIEDRAMVGAALGRAGATGVIERLPAGLETQLGRDWEGGVELSGGQWQKLALGRAMMRAEPLLLILDEPTASLDAQTEHDLFERYAGAARDTAASAGTITLLVSHRFSTVRMADLILVLDEGRIKQHGSHDELMALGGLYAELYELQARQYR
jgi:ATP-binding cassette subfamily B protein